jgi:hypothetical protein
MKSASSSRESASDLTRVKALVADDDAPAWSPEMFNLNPESPMSAQPPGDLQERFVLRATVSVSGRRWRRLPNADALRAAESDSPVYILDAATGIVRFGDGVHGARPPTGALVRVHYHQGGGDVAGDVALYWEGRWPPRPFALAKSMVPSCLKMRSTGRRAKSGLAAR